MLFRWTLALFIPCSPKVADVISSRYLYTLHSAAGGFPGCPSPTCESRGTSWQEAAMEGQARTNDEDRRVHLGHSIGRSFHTPTNQPSTRHGCICPLRSARAFSRLSIAVLTSSYPSALTANLACFCASAM